VFLARVTRHDHLGGVDDDDVVAVAHRRLKRRTVLASQQRRHFRGDAAERAFRGIDNVPRLLDVTCLERINKDRRRKRRTAPGRPLPAPTPMHLEP